MRSIDTVRDSLHIGDVSADKDFYSLTPYHTEKYNSL